MRRLRFVPVLVWISVGLSALPIVASPPDSVGETAKRAGNSMYEAFRKGDLDSFASYTYPGLLKLLGGKEKMIALLKRGRADMEREGARFVSGAVEAPAKIVKAGTELHALLALTQVLAVPGGELHIAGHLLGISGDGGKTWSFIDTAKLTSDNVRQVLPSFNPELTLPEKAESRFVAKP